MEQPETQDSEVIESPESAENTAADVETDDLPEGAELEESTADPDEEEVEYEGEKYKVPAKLKDALLRQSDYTRKTQEVAEIRRQAEAEKQQIAQEREFIQHNLKDVATVTALDQQIAQYQGVNWDQLTESDPVQAMKLERQLRNLQSQREQAASAVTQRQAHFVQVQQQEAARQLQEGQRVLQREIPGWNESLARELVDYGLKRGYAPEVLQNIRNPQFVIDLHNSYQFTKLREKATQKPKVVQEKPVTRIQATKATATKDPDSMSAEEWAKWRNAQIRKKR